MEEEKLSLQNSIGLCVKNRFGKIIDQNEKCLSLCGNRFGEVCQDGCMQRYSANKKNPPFDRGTFFIKEVDLSGHNKDCLIINDGKYITTILCESENAVKEQLDFLQQFELTKSELVIAGMVLRGFDNKKIASDLFISKGTLRNHLNHIYRKLPKTIKEDLLFIHKNKKM